MTAWAICIGVCIAASALLGWKVWKAPIENDEFWSVYGDQPHPPSDFQP